MYLGKLERRFVDLTEHDNANNDSRSAKIGVSDWEF
jgi:hypothetical protein